MSGAEVGRAEVIADRSDRSCSDRSVAPGRRMTRLVLDGLRKTFNSVPAVHHLDLSTDEGEFISLLGPSGCGKTTTLRCVAGFEYPDAGSVMLDGEDVTGRRPSAAISAWCFRTMRCSRI